MEQKAVDTQLRAALRAFHQDLGSGTPEAGGLVGALRTFDQAEADVHSEAILSRQVLRIICRGNPDEANADQQDRAQDYLLFLLEEPQRCEDILKADKGRIRGYLRASIRRFLYQTEPQTLRKRLRRAVTDVVRISSKLETTGRRGVQLKEHSGEVAWPERILHKTGDFDHAALEQGIRKVLLDAGAPLTRAAITDPLMGILRKDPFFKPSGPTPVSAKVMRRCLDAKNLASDFVRDVDPVSLALLRARVLGHDFLALGQKHDIQRAATYDRISRLRDAWTLLVQERLSSGGTRAMARKLLLFAILTGEFGEGH